MRIVTLYTLTRRFTGALLLPLLLLLLPLLLLCGCGSGSHGGKKAGKGTAVFTITWPALRKSTRLIPAASNVIRIQIVPNTDGTGTPYATLDATRPTNNPPTTMLTFSNLPPGQVFAAASAYPDYAAGTPPPNLPRPVLLPAQASAIVPLTIAAGQTTDSSVTMASTITSLALSTSRLVSPVGSAVPIRVTAYSGGMVVLTVPGTFQWTVSDTTIATRLLDGSGNASVLGVKRGVTTISVTDTESGKSAQGSVLVPGLALSPWPKFHQNELNQGQGGTAPSTAGLKKWSRATGNAVEAAPAIGADGTLYVGSDDHNLYALNSATGAVKWMFPTGDAITSSPTIGADGTIYVGSNDGNLYALMDNGTSYALKWTYAVGAVYVSSPTIGPDGTIYLGTDSFNIYAISDRGNSAVMKWMYHTGLYVRSSPAIGSDGTIYIGSDDQYLYALKYDDVQGQVNLKWRFYAGNSILSSPCVGPDGAIYVGCNNGYIYALVDGGDHATNKWSSPFVTGNAVENSPALGADGTLYIGSNDGHLYAINSATGAQKWAYPTGSPIFHSSPAVGGDGTVYVGSMDGNFHAVNGATGARKWVPFATNFAIDSSPAIGPDGTVFFGSDDGNVYAIK